VQMIQNKNKNNNWPDTKMYGDFIENVLSNMINENKIEGMSDASVIDQANEPDMWVKWEGEDILVEVKGYKGVYTQIGLETKVENTETLWLRNDDIKVVVCFHNGWFHFFDASKLRGFYYEYKNKPLSSNLFYCDDVLNNGRLKHTEFINLGKLSTFNTPLRSYDDKEDPKRFDMSKVEYKYQAYLGSKYYKYNKYVEEEFRQYIQKRIDIGF